MLKLRQMGMLGLAALAGAAALHGDGLNAEGDWQAWYGMACSARSGKWKLKVEDEIRAGDDLRLMYYNHLDFGLTRSMLSWLDLGASFRVIEEKKNGAWEVENRPYVDASLKWRLGGWDFNDRNRLEYRELENAPNRWRYRNKLTVYPPIAGLDGRIKPYAADEIYQDLSGKGFERNRVYLGSECRLTEWLKGDLYYLWQASYQGEEWVDVNIIGLKVEARF